ncbi:E3 SUMO-protein ligase ZBED1 [Frankliniella fusca]|uniref:E3 SUMO-protein ligase ZBED1 n=1 Tax=Frankliniella fusca TaxID=407009 RepID=A0AAE1GVQ4_9NEOP|nr:E3 SUMO-protein ligase ZBED1 [Frankliniella fusca]
MGPQVNWWDLKYTPGTLSSRLGPQVILWDLKYTNGNTSELVGPEIHPWDLKYTSGILTEHIYNALEERRELGWLKHVQKDKLQMFVDLLTPFKVESVKLQADNIPTLQLVCLSKAILKRHCSKPSEDELISVLKQRMLKQIDRVFELDMLHMIASFLWPSSRKLLMLSEEERVQVHSEIRSVYLQGEPPVEGNQPAKRPRRSSDESAFLEDDDEQVAGDEIEVYLKEPKHEDSDLLEWWRNRKDRFPQLAALASKILIIPATSASAEREFSEAGHVYREKRLSLKPSTTSTILFENSNADLIAELPQTPTP